MAFVARRRILLSVLYFSMAGLTAGSIPIIGMSGYFRLITSAPALVAVLQAITMAFDPFSTRKSIASSEYFKMSSLLLLP